MGLLKAGVGALGGVLADSWRDFFYCESMTEDTLAAKGEKRTSAKGRSSNVRGEENIISDGSIIAVNDGQCMIIVESGEIVDVCAEPGQFVYDRSTEPSIFYGSLGEGIANTFSRIGQRFTFGGDTGKDQRIYFFNTKEIYGNKYGTASPIPFRIVDKNIGLDMDTEVRCNGEYSYKLTDPLLFYKNVCGNVEENYTRDRIDSQLKSELLTAMQPSLARISAMGVRYSAIPAHTTELAAILNEELSAQWSELRGISIAAFGINSISAPDAVEDQIRNLQAAAALRDPNMAAANIAMAQSDAMRTAASNEGGAAMGFMGMGMANAVGGMNTSQLFQQGQQQYAQPQYGQQQYAQQQPAPVGAGAVGAAGAATWACPKCSTQNTGKFCGECGTPRPEPQGPWTCPKCGNQNSGKFCGECGTPKP